MKKSTRKQISLEPPNLVAILAIVTEMVRRLNENISKVQLKPLDNVLVAPRSRQHTEASEA
jgi:hypothetical protein